MKLKLLFLLALFAWGAVAYAEDIDIYGISNIEVKPNVLIILDNSGSMSNVDVYEEPYSTEYDGDYSNDAVYVEETTWVVDEIVCHTETVENCEDVWVDGHYSEEQVCENQQVCVDWVWRNGRWRCIDREWQEVCEYPWISGHWEQVCEDVEQQVCEEQGHDETTWTLFFADINSDDPRWKDSTSKNNLLEDGWCSDKLYKENDGDVDDTQNGTTKTYRMGNYLNYLALLDDGGSGDYEGGSEGEYRSRMEVAKEVVANLIIDNFDNVNFGLMAFNESSASDYYRDDNNYSDYYGNGGYIVAGCGADLSTLIGSFDPDEDRMADDEQTSYGAVGSLESTTNTPLAETLAEAGLYFAGKTSFFNSAHDSYALGHYSHSCTDSDTDCLDYSAYTPIDLRCQKNYIILVTDGQPTQDDDKIGDYNYIISSHLAEAENDDYNSDRYSNDGDNSRYSYLDDVAYFLKHNDLSDLGSTGDFEEQTITTYTIGFATDLALLEKTAEQGGGEYYQAFNASSLNESLNTIIAAISVQNEVFTAAAVPVSRANRAYAGNYVYYGMFQPTNTGNWYGNLKKYAITDNGVIQDMNSNAIESSGTVIDNAVSYWSDAADGPAVTAGGAGEVLQDRTAARNIYTYTGTDTNLTDDSNLFVTDNDTLTGGTYAGLTTTVIDAVRTGVADDWPLGSLLHSQPVVVHYDDKSVIYAGANDGMLHCFDDDNGEELWGFIPPDLLGYLSLLASPNTLEYFVDGTPVTYHYDHDDDDDTEDKKLLIFGERRGGLSYTALDITDYDAPGFAYSISDGILGTGQESLGQSWATPQALEMVATDGSSTADVFLMAGGYDINQDRLPTDEPPSAATDSTGRAVYAVDAETGTLFGNFLFSNANYSAMTHSIIAVSGFENPKSTTTTRVYAGDMAGNLFAFRDDIFHRNLSSSLADNFSGLYDGQEDGAWGQRLKLYAVPYAEGDPAKKIWYAPNIVNEYYPVEFTYPAGEISETEAVVVSENRVGDYVFFGTGDRAHPERTDIVNGFYAIKNDWQWSSETPTIVEAYIDTGDNGKVKAKSNDQTLVDWDADTEDTVLYLLDVTDNLLQNDETDADVSQALTNYVTNALDHENNRGWFILLDQDPGEKVVASPLIFDGVVYFSTYVPDDEEGDDSDDPCAVSGAGGNGYLYALEYENGGAAINFDGENDEDIDGDGDVDDVLEQTDRRQKLNTKGIPPQPVLVVHEGKPTIITGFETIDPQAPVGLERAFWRQLNN